MFEPQFRITAAMAKRLMAIERDRHAVDGLPITAPLLESLRRSARLRSTHYSTRIEGNRLTAAEVEKVLAGASFPGRERDEAEARNHHAALEYVEKIAGSKGAFTEKMIRTIHGLVEHGRATATPYRKGQNVIRDGRTGAIVYLPPEAKDVPALMRGLVEWIVAQQGEDALPVPLVAGLAHYQFATIHPYYDGNGRTARLLATLLMHRGGYGLRGIYALEEYYAKNLEGYYTALARGGSHNYYFGRSEADVTPFADYFLRGVADAFQKVRRQAEETSGSPDHFPLLRLLNPRQREALPLFRDNASVTSGDVAAFLRLPLRSAALLCGRWVAEGVLEMADASKRNRRYRLAAKFDALAAKPG